MRRYFEALFDGELGRRFVGAAFDEFVALLRLRYPAVTERWAVEMAGAKGRPEWLRRAIDEPVTASAAAFTPADDDLACLADPTTLVRVLRRGRSDLRDVPCGARRGATESFSTTVLPLRWVR